RAELGDYYVSIAARGGHHATESRYDPADFSLQRCRWHRNDTMTSCGQVRPAQEIALAADSSNLHSGGNLGVDLSGQINLDGRIDGDEIVELAQDFGAMGMHEG